MQVLLLPTCNWWYLPKRFQNFRLHDPGQREKKEKIRGTKWTECGGFRTQTALGYRTNILLYLTSINKRNPSYDTFACETLFNGEIPNYLFESSKDNCCVDINLYEDN